MSIAKVLQEARARYAACPSHAPFGATPDHGSYCAVSACYAASFAEPALDALKAAAGVGGGSDGAFWTNEPLIHWNADATTTEVLAAFDHAIAMVEAGAGGGHPKC